MPMPNHPGRFFQPLKPGAIRKDLSEIFKFPPIFPLMGLMGAVTSAAAAFGLQCLFVSPGVYLSRDERQEMMPSEKQERMGAFKLSRK